MQEKISDTEVEKISTSPRVVEGYFIFNREMINIIPNSCIFCTNVFFVYFFQKNETDNLNKVTFF